MLYELRIHHITRYLLPYLSGATDSRFHEGYSNEHTSSIGKLLNEIYSNPLNEIKVLGGEQGLDGICGSCPNNSNCGSISMLNKKSTDVVDLQQFGIVENGELIKLLPGKIFSVKQLEKLENIVA